jgi:hypothetical protein
MSLRLAPANPVYGRLATGPVRTSFKLQGI